MSEVNFKQRASGMNSRASNLGVYGTIYCTQLEEMLSITDCCLKCGSSDSLEFDHVVPISKNGPNTIFNIQVLCSECNAIKRAEYEEHRTPEIMKKLSAITGWEESEDQYKAHQFATVIAGELVRQAGLSGMEDRIVARLESKIGKRHRAVEGVKVGTSRNRGEICKANVITSLLKHVAAERRMKA